MLVFGLALVPASQPAQALPHPSFRVVCLATHFAKDDPIVFPGQSGASHQHAFYGNRSTNAHSTAASLMAAGPSNCERHFSGPDRSSYWTPSLYKNGQEIRGNEGRMEMAAYYKRAGGPEGRLVDQAFPQGLRIIAGNPASTTPQSNITFRCMTDHDTGHQDKYGHALPSCDSDQSLMAEITFPDCWDGKRLDSPDHKSHMTYSGGVGNTCPASHPVKLPQLTLEPIWKGVDGPANQFTFSSGNAYTMHADFFAAWDPRGQAALVNECLNKTVDCNPKQFTDISQASVTQAQIDQQLVLGGQAPVPTAPVPVDHQSHAPTTPAAPAPQTPAATQSTDDAYGHEHEDHDDTEVAGASSTNDDDQPLPATGQIATLSAAAGLGLTGGAYYAYRKSRISLREALLSRIRTK